MDIDDVLQIYAHGMIYIFTHVVYIYMFTCYIHVFFLNRYIHVIYIHMLLTCYTCTCYICMYIYIYLHCAPWSYPFNIVLQILQADCMMFGMGCRVKK